MAKAKFKKKSPYRDRVLPTMPPHVDRLYKAVAEYVKKSGGEVVVIGGIQIQQWPLDSDFKFTVGIQCTGTKPPFAANGGEKK